MSYRRSLEWTDTTLALLKQGELSYCVPCIGGISVPVEDGAFSVGELESILVGIRKTCGREVVGRSQAQCGSSLEARDDGMMGG
jgi:hypothetical protein